MVVGQEGKYHHTFGWKLDDKPPKDPYFDLPILTVFAFQIKLNLLLQVSQTIMMTAYIKKEGVDKQLVLLIQTDGGYVSINHAGMENPDNSDSDLSYTGPVSFSYLRQGALLGAKGVRRAGRSSAGHVQQVGRGEGNR